MSAYISGLTALTDTDGPIVIGATNYDGRLYHSGNTIPAGHDTEGDTKAALIEPLDTDGNPDSTGDIVVLLDGMSNAKIVAADMLRKASSRADNVVLVNGAQTGHDAEYVANNLAAHHAVVATKLADKGVTADQVQFIWLYTAIADPPADENDAIDTLHGYLKTIIMDYKTRYPNVQIVALQTREYGGWGSATSPEPGAYYSALAVWRLIDSQVQASDGDLAYATTPFLFWDTDLYTWANGLGSDEVEGGTPGRADGLEYLESDFTDGTHPSDAGADKISDYMIHMFETSPYTIPWWYPSADSTTLTIKKSLVAGSSLSTDSYTGTNGVAQYAIITHRCASAAVPNEPTATGGGTAWATAVTKTYASTGAERARVSILRSVGDGVADTLDVDWGGQDQSVMIIVVVEVVGIYTGGVSAAAGVTQAKSALVDAGTEVSVAMDAETDEIFMLAAVANTIGSLVAPDWSEIFDEDSGGSPTLGLEIQTFSGYDSLARGVKSGPSTFNAAIVALGLQAPPPLYLLELLLSGPGSVTSSPAGINAPAGASSADFYEGEVVALTAVPDYPGVTVTWAGDYDTVSGLTATVTIDAAKSISATFNITTYSRIIETPPKHEVWLCTDLGQKIKLLSPAAFDYVMGLNEVGAFSVLLPGDFPYSLIQVDRQIQFWRRHRGRHTPELDQVGFLRRARYETNERGQTTLRISGPDIQELLFRRIVAYAASTAGATIATNVDDGMKDIFTENFIDTGVTARNIGGNGVTVQQDLSDGVSITKSFSWRNVRSVLQDLNAASRTDGTEVFYRIVWTGIDANERLQLQFQTHTGQPGRDLTYPNTSMIFGLEHGNLVSPVLEIDHTNEINFVYVGGQGEGTDRNIAEVSDEARIKKSVWNRREGFRDARDQTTDAGLIDAGNAMLAEYRPRERFSGRIMDTKATPYGSGWRLGDKVSAAYIGRQFDDVLRKVSVQVSAGDETIRGAFEGGRLITNPVIDDIVGSYAKLKSLLEELASREDAKYMGIKASDFTTADLAHHGQYGLQTAANEVQINFNGAIRSIPTSAV